MSSILDRVLLSQEISERQRLSPVDISGQCLKLISAREADVLRQRFGLDGDEPKTLEVIGKRYAVTRERVRQIERQGIERIRHAKAFAAISEGISNLVHHSLVSHGHIRRQDVLMDDLLSQSGDSPANKSSLAFIIEQLLTHVVEEVDDADRHPRWKLKDSALELFHDVIDAVRSILNDHTQPLEFQKLAERFLAHPTAQARAHEFRAFSPYGAAADDEDQEIVARVIQSYLECSRHIQQNPFGEWGLSTWHSIRPKRMSDKIYLVLKKHGSPLHFTVITEHINHTKFDHKTAHAPTVHNELILDARFVLVGRGMYALQEWGYEPGVVADVIEKVLTRAGGPLTRDEIVDAVTTQRMVKRGTILLALNNRGRFAPLPDGRYASAHTPQPSDTIPPPQSGDASPPSP